MKKLAGFILFSLLVSISSFGQNTARITQNKWFVDFNVGGTYQTSDIQYKPGSGVGFNLGRTFGKESNFFNLDLRLRYLFANMYGSSDMPLSGTGLANHSLFNGNSGSSLDYNSTQGIVHQNYNMILNRYAFESALVFNELKQKTNIIVSLFGGVGLSSYNTYTDQLDASGNQYDYASLNLMDGPTPESIRDNDYETNALGGTKNEFMPSLGAGLGYQFSPVFSLGIEHKTTFTLGNTIDGFIAEGNDYYHYTALGFRFKIGSKSKMNPTSQTPIKPTVAIKPESTIAPDNTRIISSPKTSVVFTDPSTENVFTLDQNNLLTAKAENITKKEQISVFINSVANTNFSYNPSNGIIKIPTTLPVGVNKVDISVNNNGSSAYDRINIIIEGSKGNPPVVIIAKPLNKAIQNNNTPTIRATVSNVKDAKNISVTQNNKNINNYTFNPQNGTLVINSILINGNNTFKVTANNESGNDSKSINITYTIPDIKTPEPIINKNEKVTDELTINDQPTPCIKPSIEVQNSQTNTVTSTYELKALVKEVSSNFDITITLNNSKVIANTRSQRNNTFLNTTLYLKEGSNTILLAAQNQCGSVENKFTVTYTPCLAAQFHYNGLPVINTENSTHRLSIPLSNTKKNEIKLIVNGRDTNFDFSNNTITSFITLNNGDNNVQVIANNSCNTEQLNLKIIKSTCPRPVAQWALGNSIESKSKNYELTATLSNVSKEGISLLINGKSQSFTLSNKQLRTNLILNEGYNNVKLDIQNKCGSTSLSSSISYQTPCLIPIIKINSPTKSPWNSANIQSELVAKVDNVTPQDNISLTLNGQVLQYKFNGQVLQSNFKLNSGSNTVNIKIANACGSVEEKITFNYTACKMPVLTFNNLPAKTDQKTLRLTGVVGNTNNQELQFLVNNQAQNFQLFKSAFTASVNLKEGVNNIMLVAKNSCGREEQTWNIQYNEPCSEPIITNSTVPNKSENKNAAISILLNNVLQNQIKLSLNNTQQTFQFNQNKLSANLALQNGINQLVLVAKTNCGSIKQNWDISYNAPCISPLITVNSPPRNPWSTPSETNNLVAKISNISPTNSIAVTLNGQPLEYKFNGNVLQSVYKLREGKNTISINAKNNCGSINEKITINHTACKTPSIVANVPNSSKTSSMKLGATIHNATQNEITLTINGKGQSFSLNQNKLNANINLNEGNNTIALLIKTTCGQDQKQWNVVYEKPCSSPTIVANVPSSSKTSSIKLGATIQNASQNEITLTVNGKGQSFTLNQNKLNANLNLNEGNNTIALLVKTACGQDQKQWNVVYEKPCSTPTIVANVPNSSKTSNMQLGATIQNASQNEITLTVNGKGQNFTLNQNKLNANLSLSEGNNTIALLVKTACGQDQKQWSVTYEQPCSAPTIVANVPISSKTSSMKFGAAIQNASQNEVTLTINGKGQNFSLNQNKLNANLNLKEGNNTIALLVKTACGQDQKQWSVTYEQPCEVAKVTINSPPRNPWTTPSETNNLVAKISGSVSSSDIKVTLNGQPLPFKFNGNILQSVYKLKEGLNIILISISNACSNKNEKLEITYTPTNKQQIDPTNKSNPQNAKPEQPREGNGNKKDN